MCRNDAIIMQYIICTLKWSDIQNIGPVVGVLRCDITLGKGGDTNKKVGRAGGLTPETHYINNMHEICICIFYSFIHCLNPGKFTM